MFACRQIGKRDGGSRREWRPRPFIEPMRDVPLWIEGPAEPIRRLEGRLRMLAQLVQAAHGWTAPVMLTDEVVVMAFRDLSARGRTLADGRAEALDYLINLVRPVVFPFLQDCAQVADLRLTDRIEIGVHQGDEPVAELSVRWDQITPANGEDLLVA